MAGSGPCQARLRRLFRPHRAHRRRSSVVEHVIGNDGVSSSILLGGTTFLSSQIEPSNARLTGNRVWPSNAGVAWSVRKV